MVKLGGLLFVVSLVVGLYFLNLGLNFVEIPETFSSLNKWANLLGGILLIVGGFFSMRAFSKKK